MVEFIFLGLPTDILSYNFEIITMRGYHNGIPFFDGGWSICCKFGQLLLKSKMKFELTVLGSNSATPTSKRFPSCHVLNVREKLFMIDCGEGSQIQLRRYKLKFSRLNHIFISHLHGDHCLGLPGMIASFNLMGRTQDLNIYAHTELKVVLHPVIEYFAHGLTFKIIYHDIDAKKNNMIYEDRSMEVWTIPLKHRVPTCGFYFKEKKREKNILKEKVEEYKLSISEIVSIKAGSDLTLDDGTIVPNSELSTDALPRPRSYAYISDTKYKPSIAPLIEGVDLLYHEATFLEDDEVKLSKTFHSSARQAAEVAKLAQAKKLLIGHFSARYNSAEGHEKLAQTIFPNTIAVEDGMRFTVGE